MERITKLSKNERKFIDLYGTFFEDLGRSGTVGKIFALLLLKTHDENTGLTQEDIAIGIDRSVSTVSRIINQMVDLKYCNFTEDLNDKFRREKRYYISEGVFKMAKSRTEMRLRESENIMRKLSNFEKELSQEAGDEELQSVVEELKFSYSKIMELFSEFVLLIEKKYYELERLNN